MSQTDFKILRSVIEEELKIKAYKEKKLKEDYARGIPDFALSQVSSEACESLKRYIVRYIQTVSSNPTQKREMIGAANAVLDKLETDLKAKMEDSLLQFMRST